MLSRRKGIRDGKIPSRTIQDFEPIPEEITM